MHGPVLAAATGAGETRPNGLFVCGLLPLGAHNASAGSIASGMPATASRGFHGAVAAPGVPTV